MVNKSIIINSWINGNELMVKNSQIDVSCLCDDKCDDNCDDKNEEICARPILERLSKVFTVFTVK